MSLSFTARQKNRYKTQSNFSQLNNLQDNNMNFDENWELCKENIQPLKSGRKIGDLNKALADLKPLTLNEQLREQKQYLSLL
jgi:hypothetical protein